MQKQKSIVFLGHYNGGKEDFDTRHYFFAKELLKFGYKASIINAAYSHRIRDAKIIKKPYILNNDNGILFISIKTTYYEGNGFKRILNMFSFVYNIVVNLKAIFKELGHIDSIIIATPHPFVFFAAKIMAIKSKAKLIIDLKDIWPLSIMELMNVKKFHPFVLLLGITERLMYRYSNAIISPLNNIDEYFKDYGFNIKAEYIPTGLNLLHYDKINNLSLEINLPDDKFIIGYIGGLTQSNAIDFLLKAAPYFEQKYNDILFLIVGDGAQKNYLKNKYFGNNILYLDAVGKSQAFKFMQRCDLLYRASPKLNLYKYGISPLKINEYMYSGTPILHVFDFKGDIVHDANCGITVRYGDEESLIATIESFYNMPKEEKAEMGANGKRFVANKLSYSKIVNKLVEVLN